MFDETAICITLEWYENQKREGSDPVQTLNVKQVIQYWTKVLGYLESLELVNKSAIQNIDTCEKRLCSSDI